MGRTAILLVVVFNLTFMVMGFRMSSATNEAYKKYAAYADIEQASLALESAANIAISNALLTSSPTKDTVLASNDTLNNAIFTIKRFLKYSIYGNRDGDSLYILGTHNLTGCSTSLTNTTSVRVRGNAFSQYVFYSESEVLSGTKIYWGDGEVCRGRLHTQDNLYVDGAADFKGKVTTKGNVTISSGAKPTFEQGYTHADISIPTKLTDLTTLGTAAGVPFYNGVETYVQFLSDGEVVVRAATIGTDPTTVWGYTSATSGTVTTATGGTVPKYAKFASTTALTSSGVFLVQDAPLHVKGVLDGVITLGAVDGTVGGTKSKVMIDSSLVYKAAPPSTQVPTNVSNDMLGIVATNNILVTDNTNNNQGSGKTPAGVTINASMFSQVGGFGAENYSTRGYKVTSGGTTTNYGSGTLKIVGGIQQHQRNPVGQSPAGFLKDYDFDNNLLTTDPVGYPKTPFVVQSWIDNTTIPSDFWQ